MGALSISNVPLICFFINEKSKFHYIFINPLWVYLAEKMKYGTSVWAVSLWKWISCFFLAENGGDFMAVKNKIVNIKVFFDCNQDASQVFAEVIAQKIKDTKRKDYLAK